MFLFQEVRKNTRLSQKFGNILVIHEVQFGNFGRFCRSREVNETHRTTRCQACLILPECYSLIYGFTSMALSKASESTVLNLLDYAGSSRFLLLERNFLNYLLIVLGSTASSLSLYK